MNELIFVVPNTRIAETITRVVQSRNYHFPVHSASKERALDIVKKEIVNGAKVVISLGVTAEYLKANIDIPVIKMLYSEFEFISAIREGLEFSDRVAVIGSDDIAYLTERLLRIFDKKVGVFTLNLWEPIDLQAKRVLDRGYEVIISGTPSVEEAIRHKKFGILPDIDAKIVEFNMDNALYILQLLQETEERYQTMDAILHCTSEVLIGTDAHDHIIFTNPTAERIMGAHRDVLHQQSFRKALASQGLIDVLDDHTPEATKKPEKLIVTSSLPVVVKDCEIGHVYALKEVEEIQALEQRIRKELIAKGHFAKHTFADIIGNSHTMKRLKATSKKYAPHTSSILIHGQSGTGKELFAQSIHHASLRSHEAFVAVNCAALPEQLLESELFGYVKGAFTGARQEGKPGLFEMAHKGTLFLDEIGEMPLSMQARLLRVLQEREVHRIGDDKVIPVDVRLLSATNRDLTAMITKGEFREDLYYRLCILELKLPPLSQHADDIPEIVQHLLVKRAQELNIPKLSMSASLMDRLTALPWPGNVRQLSNFIERLSIMSENHILDNDDFDEILQLSPLTPHDTHSNDLASKELHAIEQALQQSKGNKSKAAKLLGIHPSTLWRKLKKHHL